MHLSESAFIFLITLFESPLQVFENLSSDVIWTQAL